MLAIFKQTTILVIRYLSMTTDITMQYLFFCDLDLHFLTAAMSGN